MSAPINPRPGPADVFDRDTLEDTQELEDTQPSVLWWPDRDEDFWEAPTIPGFRMRADGSVVHDASAKSAGDDETWDRVLRAVAVAVRRVFASHSIS